MDMARKGRYMKCGRCTNWMMLFCLLVAAWSIETGHAQQMEVTTVPDGSGEWVGETRLQKNADRVHVDSPEGAQTLRSVADLSVSPNRNFWGVIQRGEEVRMKLFNGKGQLLLDHDLDFIDTSDETLALYVLDNGTYYVRDNVANFTRHDLDGSIDVRHSNFSGAVGGERPSYLVSDRFGLATLFVVPEIQYGENRGSMIRLLKGYDGETETVHESRNRTLVQVRLSPDGRQILLIQAIPGSQDRVVELFDRFGNPVQEIDSNESWIGGSIDESGEVVTLFSTSRVQSFRIETSERLGSSTVRGGEVLFGGYCLEREEMVVLTGEIDDPSGTVSEAELQVVSLRARSLIRESVPGGVLRWHGLTEVRLDCGESIHEIHGVGRTVRVRPTF